METPFLPYLENGIWDMRKERPTAPSVQMARSCDTLLGGRR